VEKNKDIWGNLIVRSNISEENNKKYWEVLKEISSEKLFEGFLGYGLFSEKFPPFLNSESFYNECVKIKNTNFFKDCQNEKEQSCYKGKDFIRYENSRHINIPRQLAIPNPIAYHNLCKEIAERWDDITNYFKEKTDDLPQKISRIHIRKMEGKKYLFEMNYKKFMEDDKIEIDLEIKSNILVKADISNCFPSIYSHSIPWAILGKEMVKKDMTLPKKERKYVVHYSNKLDFFTRNVKFGETNGILIGPHASNLISEIILVAIDFELNKKGYKFIRRIDDYSCYVKDHNECDKFLRDLSSELKKYDLVLNRKKTEIHLLPIGKDWPEKLKDFQFPKEKENGKTVFPIKELKSYLNLAIDLFRSYDNNSSILNYAIKAISKKHLWSVEKAYFLKKVHHLVLLYPYLIPLLEKHVFVPFEIETNEIKKISQNIFDLAKEKEIWEAVSYSLYFAIKYEFELSILELYDLAKQSNDCILLLLAYLYDSSEEIDKYKKLANLKKESDFDRYWLFIYEVLEKDFLDKPYCELKEKNVSFLCPEFIKKNNKHSGKVFSEKKLTCV
jgi:hypothetical protein